MRKTLLIFSIIFLTSLLLFNCNKKIPTEDEVEQIGKLPMIKWDSTSRRIISEQDDPHYNGYSRLIQLNDQSLFAVYFNNVKGIMGKRSYDYGNTWNDAFVILPNSDTHEMNNPEIIQLNDGSLLISTNLRPFGLANNNDTTRLFQIGVIKSSDNGANWSELKIIYSASWKFDDGCWEPKAIQISSGEIQLYFANEAPYIYSQEQNISMFSSFDGGQSWTSEPVIVSFRKNFRDGMPTPIILNDKSEIVMPIEDNGYGFTFKISTIRNSISDGWSEYIDGNSTKREYALKNILPPSLGSYAGAPYITQLPSGETIMSYQSTFGREGNPYNPLEYAIPYVVVGDANARNFQNASAPFEIPEGKSGLWNSVAALDNGEIVLLTSSNGISQNGKHEVWMIKGELH